MSEKEEREEFKLEQEAKFKTDKFYFSFSSLVKLMLDPRVFYRDYILKERKDISGKHLDIGSLLHCLVLEPENFEEKFVIMSKKVPGGKIKDVIDVVYKEYAKPKIESNPNDTCTLLDFKSKVIAELINQDLYQGLVDAKRSIGGAPMLTGDQKRIEKAITPETNEYWRVLIESEKKTIVDMDMSLKAKEKADAILNCPEAIELLTARGIEQDVRKELELKADIEGYEFGLKGILDCVKIDYENCMIHIVDLKTTSKSLSDWTKSFMTSEYNYWLQPIVYKELLLSLIPKKSKAKWGMKIHYVIVDKDNQVYCCPVSSESLQKWEVMAKGAYDIASWHLEANEFKLPYNYAKGLVEL